MIKKRELSFMQACDIGSSLIVIDELGRGIFQIDKSDMSSHLLAMLKSMKHRRNLYQCAERLDNEIFFFPYCFVNDEVIIYHLDYQQIEYLDLEKVSSLVRGDYKPLQRIDNSIWMFPTDFTRDIIIFHMDTRKIDTIIPWKQFMQGIKLDYMDVFGKVGKPIEVKNTLYYPVKGTNYIVGIDRNNYKIQSHLMPLDVKLHVMRDYDGQRLWIAERHNKGIIAWNPETGDKRQYSMAMINDKLRSDNWTWSVLCGKRYLWLLPNWDNRLMKMDYETGDFEFLDVFPQKLHYSNGKNGSIFYTSIKYKNMVDIYPFTANIAIHLDLENDILLDRYEQIFLPVEWSDQDILDYQLQEACEYELERIDQEIYMDFFFRSIHNWEKKTQSFSNGKNIWIQISGE